ncbi:MAG TPA: ABC transporter substrate-binding protein [Solirubrobacterales bacterium]
MNSGARSKLRILVPVLVALGAALLAGCGGGGNSGGETGGTEGAEATSAPAHRGGTLNIAQGEEAIDLDPVTLFAPGDTYLSNQINEPLFKESTQRKVVPWLVEKYETSGGQRVWTLHLRKGVKFSNGKPLTSADVVFTLERVRGNESWTPYTENIAKVQATSPSTVVITNKEPAAELKAILALWPFEITPDNLAGESEKEFAEHPIGTGPFMLTSWKKGESMTMDANPHYWQSGKPYVEKLVWHTVTDANSRVSQLQGGDLDVVSGIPWAQVEGIENSPETDFLTGIPLGYVDNIWLNAQKPLFKDPRVREAINLALDREGMNQAVLLGKGEPAYSLVPPGQPFQDKSLKAPEQDIEKAKELLAEAVKEGAPQPSFTILVQTEDDFWPTASQIVQQNLEEAGFKVQLKKLDTSSAIELLEAGEYEAAFGFTFSEMPSPAEAFGFYNGFNGSFTNADTTKTTKIMAEALSTVNEQQRAQHYYELQRIIAEENYDISVVYKPYSWAFRDDVSGLFVGVTGIPYFAETSIGG